MKNKIHSEICFNKNVLNVYLFKCIKSQYLSIKCVEIILILFIFILFYLIR